MEKKRGLNIALLYLSLHNLLKKKIGLNRYITRKEFYCILGKHFLIPKPTRCAVIREMELMNLVKAEGKDTLKILDYDLDIERDVQKFYKTLELF